MQWFLFKSMIGIYKITNKLNGRVYIGESRNIKRRIRDHKKGGQLQINKDIKALGKEHFLFEIVELCDESVLDEREIYYISKFDARNPQKGYNIARGGKHVCMTGTESLSSKFSEEVVSKIREMFALGYEKQTAYKEICKDVDMSINTFACIWNGRGYPDILPDVYNEEYKEFIRKERGRNKSKRIETDSKKFVLEIREDRYRGVSRAESYRKYKDKMNINTFSDIWYNHVYQHIQPSFEPLIKLGTQVKEHKRNSPVDMYSKDGIFIKHFTHVDDAVEEIKGKYDKNVVSLIYLNCRGGSKTAYGYKWEFSKNGE